MKISYILFLLVSACLGAVVTLYVLNNLDNNRNSDTHENAASSNPGGTPPNQFKENRNAASNSKADEYCDYNFQRLNGYKYIKPLVDGEPQCESAKYLSMKNEIISLISNCQKMGKIVYSSVYFKSLASNDWMIINPNQEYHPGSLIKVPILITYLRMAEQNPNLWNKQIEYLKDNTIYPEFEIESDSIILGNRYKIKDLLYFMVAHSDNRATLVLENNLNNDVFMKTFTDLDIKALKYSDTSYRIGVREYSNFFSVIYNASYLTIASSEYAGSLLSECTYKEGITRFLPADVKVAHKFGEWGGNNQAELHETGIVYLNGNPYLLSIMTRGRSFNDLSDLISRISKSVYDRMAGNSKQS